MIPLSAVIFNSDVCPRDKTQPLGSHAQDLFQKMHLSICFLLCGQTTESEDGNNRVASDVVVK